MIIVRGTFHCKYGMGDEMVELVKEIFDTFAGEDSPVKSVRILTDLSGRFFTVTTEVEIESIAAYQAMLHTSFQNPRFGPMFARMTGLIDSGSQNYYNIEKEYKRLQMEGKTMIIVRDTFHCKYGMGDELVELVKGIYDRFAGEGGPVKSARILTDLSGRFFTITTELELESIAAYQAMLQESFQDPAFGPMFARMMELVDSGSREYYTIEKTY